MGLRPGQVTTPPEAGHHAQPLDVDVAAAGCAASQPAWRTLHELPGGSFTAAAP